MMTSAFAFAGPWKPKREAFKGTCLVNGVPRPISPDGIITLDAQYVPGTTVTISYVKPDHRRHP